MSYRSRQPASPADIAEKVAARVKSELEKIDQEANSILNDVKESNHLSLPIATSCPFLIYEGDSLRAWSSNSIVPPAPLVNDSFSVKLLKTSGGDFLAKKWPLNNNQFLLAVIPLHRQYTIRNSYLQPEWNRKIFPEGRINIYELNTNRGTPVCIADQCLFRIGFISDDFSFHENTRGIAIIFIAISIALFIYFIAGLVSNFRLKYPDVAFLILLVSLWLVRVLMTTLNFPGRFIRSVLFDPQVFASSSLNRSLGDLFFNMITLSVVCYFLFKHYHRFKSLKSIYEKSWVRVLFSISSAVIYFFAILFPFVVI